MSTESCLIDFIQVYGSKRDLKLKKNKNCLIELENIVSSHRTVIMDDFKMQVGKIRDGYKSVMGFSEGSR